MIVTTPMYTCISMYPVDGTCSLANCVYKYSSSAQWRVQPWNTEKVCGVSVFSTARRIFPEKQCLAFQKGIEDTCTCSSIVLLLGLAGHQNSTHLVCSTAGTSHISRAEHWPSNPVIGACPRQTPVFHFQTLSDWNILP